MMVFSSVYRACFYLMLLFATLTLNVDATDSKISMLFPLATAVAGVMAFLTVDRNPRLGLSRPMAYGLLLIALILSVLEYRFEANIVLTLAHFLVYLQLVKIFLPKNVEDDWLLFGLGVMQVLVGAVISQSDRVGMLLFAWALLALWVLGLFALRREALRAGVVPGVSPGAGASPAPDEFYPGLFSRGFFFSALRVLMTTLALGGVVFLLLPRRAGSAHAQGIANAATPMTGFDDEVQLGQFGAILESDNVVMSIELFDANGRRLALVDRSLLWRGVTMEEYRAGRWHRQHRHNAAIPKILHGSEHPRDLVRQRIRLEPTDSDVLFGLRPILRVTASSRITPELNPLDGTVSRPWTRPGAYDYEVLSSLDHDGPQPGESVPLHERSAALASPSERLEHLLQVPEALRPRLRGIAQAVLKRETIGPGDMVASARALERYLRDSGQFGYTLRMDVVDAHLDPIEDFFLNRKEGHCGYFATALTLLLRSIDIPARMVNGFKGGDWNDLSRVLSVRQKHAHSWVEAYLGEGPEHTARWLTLDPTPATEREQSVARVGGIGRNLRQLTDLVRYLWVFYIVGFDAERQNTLLYEPIRALIREANDGVAIIGGAAPSAFSKLVTFKTVKQLISVRGFFVSFLVVLLLVFLFRGGFWLWRRFLRWYWDADEDAAALSAGVVFYRRLAQLLSEYGLERPPAETQHEFARRAAVFLVGRGSNTEPVADVPRQVAEAFYHVRFGHRELAPAELALLEARLDALEESLRGQQE